MKALVCERPGMLNLEEREAPASPDIGWAAVDISHVGICGTDYHIFEGKHPFLAYPRVMGHELSGRMAEAAGPFAAGDLVVINPYITCGTCRACRRGARHRPHGVAAGHRGGDLEAREPQAGRQQLDDVGLVVDDQQAGFGRAPVRRGEEVAHGALRADGTAIGAGHGTRMPSQPGSWLNAAWTQVTFVGGVSVRPGRSQGPPSRRAGKGIILAA